MTYRLDAGKEKQNITVKQTMISESCWKRKAETGTRDLSTNVIERTHFQLSGHFDKHLVGFKQLLSSKGQLSV